MLRDGRLLDDGMRFRRIHTHMNILMRYLSISLQVNFRGDEVPLSSEQEYPLCAPQKRQPGLFRASNIKMGGCLRRRRRQISIFGSQPSFTALLQALFGDHSDPPVSDGTVDSLDQ